MTKTSIKDIYQGIYKKHAVDYAVKKQEEQIQENTQQIHESSVISAYAKKSTAKTNVNDKLITALLFVKETINTNPAQAQEHLSAIVETLRK